MSRPLQQKSLTTITEHAASRVTDSATLPMPRQLKPVLPCMPNTTRSAGRQEMACRIDVSSAP